jgi:type I restriction enzyme M protein
VKSWSNGFENDLRPLRVRPPPEKNGDYAFLLHVLKSLKSTGKARSSCRTACCSAATPRPRSAAASARARLHQGHHRPAGEPVLRHRHPGLHRGARQGGAAARHRHRHLHDRRQSKGFMKDGNKNRLRARTSTRSSTPSTSRSRSALLAHGAAERDRGPRTTTTSTSRATSTPPSPKTCRTSTPTCAAASPNADLDALSPTGTPSRSCARSYSSRIVPATVDLAVESATSSKSILDSPEFQKFSDGIAGDLADRVVRRPPQRNWPCRSMPTPDRTI